MEAKKHLQWHRDPAFWGVLVSFALFLIVALAVFFSPNSMPHLRHSKQTVSDTPVPTPTAPAAQATSPVTIDARSTKKWIYFNLSEKKLVHPQFVSSSNWDLAFKRYHVIANGGITNIAARGAVADLGHVDFARASRAQAKNFVMNTRAPNGTETENLAIHHWYNYDYASHILTPMEHVYLVRTPSESFFFFRILNYYCKSGESGCITFEYHEAGR